MKYKVTKKQIIEAVMTEPLVAGMFFATAGGDRELTTCPVCAVGAVLRKTVQPDNLNLHFSGRLATNAMYNADDLDDAYESRNFLAILSTEHEAFAEQFNSIPDDGIAETELINVDLQRLHLLNVIEAFCPAVVTFEA